MKASAWLIIKLDSRGNPYIHRVVKRRPRNEMGIHITLDIDMEVLSPHIELLVDQIEQVTAQIELVVEPIE